MQNMTYSSKSQTTLRLLSSVLIFALLLPAGPAWAGLQPPLKKVTVPEPSNLSDFVKDKAAAIRLGKALFWDMQTGSDGAVACATCHYKAGADPTGPAFSGGIRSRNQVHPGPDNIFSMNSLSVPLGPNYTLNGSEFPLFAVAPADGRVGVDTIVDPIFGTAPTATITRNINDVVGSQGIPRTLFTAINPGSAQDSGTPENDPIFGSSRRVTGRNSPSVINAVFNFANFWDGRAHNIFNGENPFGPLDQSAGVWIDSGGALVKQQIAIPNASLASQATGPPLNDVEMSYSGRTFPQLGRKMLSLATPLGQQLVHPNDSVLGDLSRASLTSNGTATIVTGNPGLNTDYRTMIEAAFQDIYWNSAKITSDGFEQIEANFSLFWGLSIQLYEATLVSDRAPFDRFQLGNLNALSLPAQLGLATFDGKCAICHSGAELSDAVAGGSVVPICVAPDCSPVSFTTNTNHRLIRQGQTNMLGAINDAGFWNIGVRATAEDPGRGGTAQGLPLSFSRLAKLKAQGQLLFDTPELPALVTSPTQTDSVQGSFKTPGLRNVELTPPYFHNGSALTLLEVVEFYTRGGNFPINIGNLSGNRELALTILPLGKLRGGGGERFEVVEFLKSLTDERVRLEQAPFDHPQLIIPNGDGAPITLLPTGGGPAPERLNVFTMDTISTPTVSTNLIIGGFVDQTATVTVNINGLVSAATVISNRWSATLTLFTGLNLGNNAVTVTATSRTEDSVMASDGSAATKNAAFVLLPTAGVFGAPLGAVKLTNASMVIGGNGVSTYRYKVDDDPNGYSADIPVSAPLAVSGLSDGAHTVAVIGKAVVGGVAFEQPLDQPTTVSWRVKSSPPVVTVGSVVAPIGGTSLTITGTISELGTIPKVTTDTGAACSATVTDIPGSDTETWSCTLSGLKKGTNNITVTATDIARNVGSATTGVRVILPDGCFKGTATPDIGDAVKALRIAVGLIDPSVEDKLHGDVWDSKNGILAPDGKIESTDALMILKKVVGLVNF